MSKKWWITGILVLFVLIGAAIAFYFTTQVKKGTSPTSSKASNIVDFFKKDEEALVSTYKDESGFSFTATSDVRVEDVTPNDPSYYTKLSLKKDDKELVILAKDTSYIKAEDWLAKEGQGLSLVGAVSLAGISAKQYSNDTKLVTVAIDKGILYLVEGPNDNASWEDLQTKVVSTFRFDSSPSGQGTSVPADNVTYEEEVVE